MEMSKSEIEKILRETKGTGKCFEGTTTEMYPFFLKFKKWVEEDGGRFRTLKEIEADPHSDGDYGMEGDK